MPAGRSSSDQRARLLRHPCFRASVVTCCRPQNVFPQHTPNYPQVPGYLTIPKGFTSGKPVATLLKGSTLKVTLKESKMKGGYMMGEATVTDAAGNVAKVIAPNMFSGTSTIHAIDKVGLAQGISELLPSESTLGGLWPKQRSPTKAREASIWRRA